VVLPPGTGPAYIDRYPRSRDNIARRSAASSKRAPRIRVQSQVARLAGRSDYDPAPAKSLDSAVEQEATMLFSGEGFEPPRNTC